MSYGFLALNDSNEVLITSDARELALFAKEDFPNDICTFTSNDYGGCAGIFTRSPT